MAKIKPQKTDKLSKQQFGALKGRLISITNKEFHTIGHGARTTIKFGRHASFWKFLKVEQRSGSEIFRNYSESPDLQIPSA